MYTQYTSPRAGSARVRLHVVVTPRIPHLWRCRVILEHDIGQGWKMRVQLGTGLDFNFRFRENRKTLLQRRGEAPHLRPCSPGTPPRYSPHYLL